MNASKIKVDCTEEAKKFRKNLIELLKNEALQTDKEADSEKVLLENEDIEMVKRVSEAYESVLSVKDIEYWSGFCSVIISRTAMNAIEAYQMILNNIICSQDSYTGEQLLDMLNLITEKFKENSLSELLSKRWYL